MSHGILSRRQFLAQARREYPISPREYSVWRRWGPFILWFALLMPASRLALARWLVSPDHPLTSRVAVNRFWQLYFGLGLVKTAENFGSQGEPPSNPQLLDWLATEFIRTGWDVKGMQKLIVTSATYRQSSAVNKEMIEKDPENRLLARGPRFRLSAETVRDNALAASGLLREEIGGKSVYPYQPDRKSVV